MKKTAFYLILFILLFLSFWYVHESWGIVSDTSPGTARLSRAWTKVSVLVSAWVMCISGLLFLDAVALKKFPALVLSLLLIIGIAGDVAINRIFLKSPEPAKTGVQNAESTGSSQNTESVTPTEKKVTSRAAPKFDNPVQKALVFLGINICILMASLAAGSFLSKIVEKATYIIPLSLIAGIADIWSVFAPGGVTKSVVAKREVLNYALLSFPVFSQGIRPLVGGTDFIFAVLYICLSEKFNLSRVRTLILIPLSFVLSTLLAVTAGIGIPVLPIMGVLFILFHFRDIKITDRKELKEAVTGVVIVTAMLAAVTVIRGGGAAK